MSAIANSHTPVDSKQSRGFKYTVLPWSTRTAFHIAITHTSQIPPPEKCQDDYMAAWHGGELQYLTIYTVSQKFTLFICQIAQMLAEFNNIWWYCSWENLQPNDLFKIVICEFVPNFFSYVSAKYYLNRFTAGKVITKIKRANFSLGQSVHIKFKSQ